jgi:hypothetical protein
MQNEKSLIFVYNAGSEALTRMNDPLMKTAGAGSERCNLHAMTYSPVGMKKEWKRFIHDLGIPARFLSREEFISEYPSVITTFPAGFFRKGEELFQLLSTEEINRFRDLGELIGLVRQRISGFSDNQT